MKMYRISSAPPVITKAEYLAFTEKLSMGTKDERALRLMLQKVADIIYYIARNTTLAREPHYSNKECPYCNPVLDPEGTTMTFFDNGDNINDIEHEGLLNQEQFDKLMEKYPDGFWLCPSCGLEEGYKDAMEKTRDKYGIWMYSDRSHWLMETLNKAFMSKDFGDKNAYFQAILQFIHGTGRASHWFIEGGKETLDYASSL